MSRQVKRTLHRFFLWVGVIFSLGICVWGWGSTEYILGRDLVNGDALGGNVMTGGEDLLYQDYGPGWGSRYGFLSAADTLYVWSSSVADTGWVKIEGLDASWNIRLDSARVRGTTVDTLNKANTTMLWRAVNAAEFHDSGTDNEPNVGYLYIATNQGTTPDSTQALAVIAPNMNKAIMAQYTVPNAKTLIPRTLRLSWAIDSSADKYTRVGGTAAIKVRAPGEGTWKIWDQIMFRPEQGGIVMVYPQDPEDDEIIKAHSQVVVVMAITGAATSGNLDATARLDFDLK